MTKYDGRQNIYIRQSDRAKWDAITDKAAWLHSALQLRIRKPTQEEIDSTHSNPDELSPVAVGELDLDNKVIGMFRVPEEKS